ncbi:ABC transporter permease subunit [Marinomonas hwangdonensis]|uniref:ABC transporter permease subunit n=1 Tax=Marinomonas hwangdonensis TaxID=1053647 RepID=UPI001F4D7408|nr:ABC transporter permease subunit [Marinomonas hwangdonensis]
MLILVGLGFGIYAASKSIDYTWRWERIPQYIINTEATTVRAPFDGTATLEKGNQLVVTSDYGDDPLILNKFDTLLVSNGDLVFEGDPLVEIENWNIGPLTWGLVMTLQLSVVSLVFAVVIGLFAGLARLSSNPALRYLSITYIELIGGTPLLV